MKTYLKNHKILIREELEGFLKSRITDEKLVYEFMHSQFPSQIFEKIAVEITKVFQENLEHFLFEYSKEHKLSFMKLKNILKK